MRRIIQSKNVCSLGICLWLCLGVTAQMSMEPGAGDSTHVLLKPMMVLNYESDLRRKGYDPTDLESVKAAAADPKWASARWSAIVVLGARMGKEAMPIFRQALNDADQIVRCHAATLLAVFGDKEGLVRMRKDLADLTPAKSNADIDKTADLDDRQKREAKRLRGLQLEDALRAAKVLAEFGDHSGYDLALNVIKGDEYPVDRSHAVEILCEISKTDLAVLRAENRDPDAVLLALAQTEQAPGVIATIYRYANVYQRPEVGIRIMETLAKSPHVTEDRREDIERSLKYRKQDLAKPRQSAPPQK